MYNDCKVSRNRDYLREKKRKIHSIKFQEDLE